MAIMILVVKQNQATLKIQEILQANLEYFFLLFSTKRSRTRFNRGQQELDNY